MAQVGLRELLEAGVHFGHQTRRWLGGLLTNFHTIGQRIERLHELQRQADEGQLDLLPTKERMSLEAELRKLQTNLSGVGRMERAPDAVVVIDIKVEEIAVREAQRLQIPTIGLVDTNCDPEAVDFPIPGNDDAMRSCGIVTRAIGGAVAEARATFLKEEQARLEAEEKARREREAEEQARREREAEEEARREAEEQARREAAQASEQGESAAAPAAEQAPEPVPSAGEESSQPEGER